MIGHTYDGGYTLDLVLSARLSVENVVTLLQSETTLKHYLITFYMCFSYMYCATIL